MSKGLKAENERLRAMNDEMMEVLKCAEQFIANGIDNGYIRMPYEYSGDPALDTLPAIKAAIAKAEEES